MTMQRLIRWTLPVLILVLAGSTFSYLKASKPERKKPQASEKVWLVDVMAAAPQSLSPDLTLHGKVETPALVKAA
ncbi:MAG: RND transporter, partial [Gammaproteobacteria bacterium]|nr:RND transporter [Gammaproteobacteria bacterium]